jgi:hypothetical protein
MLIVPCRVLGELRSHHFSTLPGGQLSGSVSRLPVSDGQEASVVATVAIVDLGHLREPPYDVRSCLPGEPNYWPRHGRFADFTAASLPTCDKTRDPKTPTIRLGPSRADRSRPLAQGIYRIVSD